MNKSEFLLKLGEKLQSYPKSEIDKSLAYFGELIDDRVEEGMTEEEAVASFESVDEIAQKIILELPLATVVKARMKPKTAPSALTVVLLCLGFPVWFPIVISVLAVLFSLVVTVFAVILSLFVTVVAIGVSGIAAVVGSPFVFQNGLAGGLFSVGSGLLAMSLAILLFFPVKMLSVQLFKLIRLGARKLKKCFIRREAN